MFAALTYFTHFTLHIFAISLYKIHTILDLLHSRVVYSGNIFFFFVLYLTSLLLCLTSHMSHVFLLIFVCVLAGFTIKITLLSNQIIIIPSSYHYQVISPHIINLVQCTKVTSFLIMLVVGAHILFYPCFCSWC